MKTPKTIYFLAFCFAWMGLKDLDILFRHEATVDYLILSGAGLSALFFLIAVSSSILKAATVIFLLKRKAIAITTAITALVISLTGDLVVFGLSLIDRETFKQAIVIFREAKGLAAESHKVELLSSQPAMILMMLATVLFSMFMVFLVLRNRAYFRNRAAETGNLDVVDSRPRPLSGMNAS